MAEAERRLLAGETHGAGLGLVARQDFHLGLLAARGQRGVELVHPVEMVLDHALVAAGDEDEMLDAGLLAPRRPHTGSAACRRWSAFPSASPWWRAGRGCRGRRPGRRLCGFSWRRGRGFAGGTARTGLIAMLVAGLQPAKQRRIATPHNKTSSLVKLLETVTGLLKAGNDVQRVGHEATMEPLAKRHCGRGRSRRSCCTPARPMRNRTGDGFPTCSATSSPDKTRPRRRRRNRHRTPAAHPCPGAARTAPPAIP